jgi:hypothetical protein
MERGECKLTCYDPKSAITRIAYDIAPTAIEVASSVATAAAEYFKQASDYINNKEYIAPAPNLEEVKYVGTMEKIQNFFKTKGCDLSAKNKCLGVQAIADNYSCGEFVFNYISSLVLQGKLPEKLSLEEVQGAYSFPSKAKHPQVLRENPNDAMLVDLGEDGKWQSRIEAEKAKPRSNSKEKF